MRVLPTYIIAGAMRSGTTALNSYLRQHPEVGVSSDKETHFFDRNFDKGLDWYRNLFPEEGKFRAIGEATPNYMFSPMALDRLQETLPEVKLVVMLRNPIDRAYSHYWHDRARGKIEGEFEENVVRELDSRDQALSYIARGRYRVQIENILERFPPTALHVGVFEDMLDRPDDLYSSICRFIGVDDSFRPESLGAPVNSFIEFRSLALRRTSQKLPGRLKDVLGRINTKGRKSYPQMTDKVRDLLTTEFEEANQGLDKIVGKNLPWNHELGRTPPGSKLGNAER